MRHFEFDPLIFTPTIGNLKSKMGEDCGLGGERQRQSDFRFVILDFRLGIKR